MRGRLDPAAHGAAPDDLARVNSERSRVQLASGDAHRHSVPRLPSMELVNNNSERSRGRRLETEQRSQDHPANGALERDSSRGRARMQHRHRHSGRGDRFEHFPPRSARSTRTSYSNRDYDEVNDDRYVVPALPMPIAIICCVLNFILPGFGSMTASVCLLCCGKTEDMTGKEKCGSCLTVFGIGILQLVLVACFLIGWVWSCIWGVTFIGMSATFYEEENDEREREAESADRHHHDHTINGGTPHRRQLPTPQVVEDQPYPGLRYEDIHRERNRHRREQRSRRTLSRMVITPSNLFYPMRAPSNIVYSSPPPTYQESENQRRRSSNIQAVSRSHNITDRNGNHEASHNAQ